jgi:Ca2+-binding EF-hand superfamily protein
LAGGGVPTARLSGGGNSRVLNEILAAKANGEGFSWVTEKKIETMHTYFSMVDADGGGEIDSEEFTQIMKDPLFMGANVSQETCDACFLRFDTDGSGELDFEEFLHAFHDVIDESGAKVELTEAQRVSGSLAFGRSAGF